MKDIDQVRVRDPWDFDQNRQDIFDKVHSTLSSLPPVSYGGLQVSIDRVDPVEIPHVSLADQKKAILHHKDIDVPVRGIVSLRDDLGNTIATRSTTLARIPYLTQRGTFIRNGSAMSLAMQKTRRPGVYIRKTATGSYEGLFKAKDRSGFNITMEPETGKMFMKIYKAKIPLYSAMIGMGLTDEEIKADLGPLYEVNVVGKTDAHIHKMWEKMSKGRIPLGEDGYAPSIRRILAGMEVDPKVTAKTLGAPITHLSPDVVRQGIRRVASVYHGDEDSDDMDSLSFQRFASAEDHFARGLTNDHKNLMNQILFKARMTGNLDHVPANVYKKAIDDVFYKTQLGINMEDINPLESLDMATKVTSMGLGGFQDQHGVPDSSREVHPTQFGMIDAIRTPESGNVGVDSRLAWRTLKGSDGELYHRFVTPDGKEALVGSTEVDERVFAFREEYEDALANGDKYVPGMKAGRMTYVPLDEVELMLPHAAEMFNYATNLIPANSGVKGMRSLMGAKYSVTGDTEVVIKRASGNVWVGPIQAYEFQADDKSLCTSNETKTVHWQEVLERSRHQFTGRLFTIKAGHRTVRVTDHHSMVVMRNGGMVEIYPDDMKVGDILPVIPTYEVDPRPIPWYPHTAEEAYSVGVLHAYTMMRTNDVVSSYIRKRLSESCYHLNSKFRTNVVDDGVAMKRSLSELLCTTTGACPEWMLYLPDGHKHQIIAGIVQYRGRSLITPKYLLPTIRTLAATSGLDMTQHEIQGESDKLRLKFYGDSPILQAVPSRTRFGHKLRAWRPGGVKPGVVTEITWTDTLDEYVYDLHMGDNVFRTTDGIVVHNTNQALSLKDREAPLVRAELPGDPVYRDFNTMMGAKAGAVMSAVDGVVTGVTRDSITVMGLDGQEQQHELYDNFPLNRKAYIHNTPLVSVGTEVRKGQPLADSNFTKDGVLAQGKNLKVAFISFKGQTYEDGIVISESAAKKLVSEHMYPVKVDLDPSVDTDLGKFVSLFPSTYKQYQLNKLDDDGVVKIGEVVSPGDPLVLSMKRRKHKGVGMLKTGGGKQWRDDSVTWDHHDKGIVADVRRDKDGIRLSVKSTTGMHEGDKLSGLFGNKGVVSNILPDSEMPTGEDGLPIDVLLNKNGVISRHNPSQVVVESWLGKLAKATGETQVVPAFLTRSWVDATREKLAEAGLSPEETLTTPEGRKLEGVATGVSYLLKLHHLSESKGSGVGDTGYTMSGTPTSEPGGDKPKRSGTLDTEALLAHGAIDVIKDFKLIKGQDSRDYLTDLMSGNTPKKPKVPAVYTKFLDTLKASGINVVDDGDALQLRAMTDEDVLALSSGALQNSSTVKWKQSFGRNLKGDMDMNPVAGGLFDRTITGGIGGNRFAHIELPIPVPQPVYDKPIKQLLGLTDKEMYAIISGKNPLGPYGTGPEAIREALSAINVDESLKSLIAEYKSTESITKKDKLAKKIKVLKGLRNQGIAPEKMVVSNILVIPPKFRPISVNEKFEIVADANLLYKSLVDAADNYSNIVKELGPAAAGDAAQTMYKAYKAVVGLGEPIRKEHVEKKVQGLLKGIFGPSGNKTGIVQKQLLGTPASYSARGVIVPDTSLNMDQIGIPEEKAWEIFKVPLIRRMIRQTDGSPDAKRAVVRAVMERQPSAKRALMREMEVRPITYSRAPVLHKYGNISGYARIVAGDAIHVNPMVTPGLGADYDGDTFNYNALLSSMAVKDAERMLPSRNLRSVSDFKLMYTPMMDFRDGLSSILRANQRQGRFVDEAPRGTQALMEAYKRGELNLEDEIVAE